MGVCYSIKCSKSKGKKRISINNTNNEKTELKTINQDIMKKVGNFIIYFDLESNSKKDEIYSSKMTNCYMEVNSDDLLFHTSAFDYELGLLEQEQLSTDFKSFNDLTDYFKRLKSERKELDVIYFAYLWVTKNIDFNLNILSETEIEESCESILKLRKTTAKGFSFFFSSILEKCSIEIIKIKGTYKTIDFTIEGKSGALIQHEWNAVFFQGKFNLIDCVLGSGYFYKDLNFIKNFTKFFFFVSAPLLIYSHFPDIPEHSYLKIDHNLLTRDAFYLLPNFNQFYFRNKIHTINTENKYVENNLHPKNDFQINKSCNEVVLSFGIKEDVDVLTTISFLEDISYEIEELTMIKSKEPNCNEYFYHHIQTVNHTDKVKLQEVTIRIPSPGDYLLNLYLTNNNEFIDEDVLRSIGKQRKKHIEDEVTPFYYYAFSFYMNLCQIDFKEKHVDELKFPLFTNVYYEKKCDLLEPLYYLIKSLFKEEQLNVIIRIPNCLLAGIFLDDAGNSFVQLDRKEDDIFYLKVNKESIKNDRISIVASFINSEENLAYLVTFCL